MFLIPWRHVLLGCGLACLATLAMAAPSPIGPGAARHLLMRTGFGAPPDQVAALARLSREQAIEQVLAPVPRRAAGESVAFASPPPVLVYERPAALKGLSEDARKAALEAQMRQGSELRVWWANEMLQAPTPADALHERMTLFWHNHFVSSQQKVKSLLLMQQQNALLRRHALGSFAQLLHAVSKDPAMLIYLDGASNRKGSPNENFAREVMELFTLGEGQYSEQDIKEAARAFSGWSIEPESGKFRFRPRQHDDGEKTVFGQQGNLDGDAVLDLILLRPQTATFIVNKLWQEFVSPTPEAKTVQQIARSFALSGYDVRVALRGLLRAPAFWAQAQRGALIKSPVDLVIGTLRTLEVTVPDPLPLPLLLRQLGQDLFAPPNVKGWPGGEDWINSNSLLARKQWLERLLRAEEMARVRRLEPALTPLPAVPGLSTPDTTAETRKARLATATRELRFDSTRWLGRYATAREVQEAVLALPPVAAPDRETVNLNLLRSLLLDPAYQLK